MNEHAWTEDEMIRHWVGTPTYYGTVQVGFCQAAGLGYHRALRYLLARGAKKNTGEAPAVTRERDVGR